MADPTWRKASGSSYQGNCVEVASLLGMVTIRDSRNPRSLLPVSAAAWTRLLDQVRSGTYDR